MSVFGRVAPGAEGGALEQEGRKPTAGGHVRTRGPVGRMNEHAVHVGLGFVTITAAHEQASVFGHRLGARQGVERPADVAQGSGGGHYLQRLKHQSLLLVAGREGSGGDGDAVHFVDRLAQNDDHTNSIRVDGERLLVQTISYRAHQQPLLTGGGGRKRKRTINGAGGAVVSIFQINVGSHHRFTPDILYGSGEGGLGAGSKGNQKQDEK